MILSLRSALHSAAEGKVSHSFSGQTASKHLLCSHSMPLIVLELEVISEFIQALPEKEIHPYKAESRRLPLCPFLDSFLGTDGLCFWHVAARDRLPSAESPQGQNSGACDLGWLTLLLALRPVGFHITVLPHTPNRKWGLWFTSKDGGGGGCLRLPESEGVKHIVRGAVL